MKNKTTFPPGWDEGRVQRILQHYESQTEEEAVAEDEAAFEGTTQTVMEIPDELVPAVRELLSETRRIISGDMLTMNARPCRADTPPTAVGRLSGA